MDWTYKTLSEKQLELLSEAIVALIAVLKLNKGLLALVFDYD